jgi:hypothetical protein
VILGKVQAFHGAAERVAPPSAQQKLDQGSEGFARNTQFHSGIYQNSENCLEHDASTFEKRDCLIRLTNNALHFRDSQAPEKEEIEIAVCN